MEMTLIIVSVLVNILLLIYARWLIKILKVKEEEVTDLSNTISEYVSHVKGVHEMEMFYGDNTLKTLIEHGKNMIEKIENFEYVLYERDDLEGEEAVDNSEN